MNHPSLKKHMIYNLTLAQGTDAMKDKEVVFITPAGVLTGKLADPDEKDGLRVVFKMLTEKYFEENPETEKQLSGSDGYVPLRDAELVTVSGSKTRIGEMLLFYDQIIGVTLRNSARQAVVMPRL